MAGLLPAIVDRLSRRNPNLTLHIIDGEPPELQNRHASVTVYSIQMQNALLATGRFLSFLSRHDAAFQP
jgi:hypothetical protein